LKYFGGPGYAHDWITGWTNPADTVHWEIDVARPGKFEVSLSYLTPQSDVGAEVAVEVSGRNVAARIDSPTQMQPKPTRDYVRRSETGPMHWGQLRLGELTLERGRSRLIVKALSKPGNAVMDLKEVTLKRTG
jgi:arylsulfatase A